MQGMSYPDLAYEIVSPFVGDCIDEADLRAILNETYAEFRHPAVAPLVQLDHNQWVLELFQGPTLAFKDFALSYSGDCSIMCWRVVARKWSLWGPLRRYRKCGNRGCRRCENIDIFILHPHERVRSPASTDDDGDCAQYS